MRRSHRPGRGIQLTAPSSRALITASGITSSALITAVVAQCRNVRRPYRASSTVTACASSISVASSFR